MTIKITTLFDKKGLENYHHETSYKVSCMDGDWICDCALEHKRNIKIKCKHIKDIIEKEKLNKNDK